MMKNPKHKTIFKVAIFILLQVLALGVVLKPNQMQVHADSVTSTYIEDEANIFTVYEEQALIEEMKQLQKTYDIDIVILTVDGRDGISAQRYLDNYSDAQYYAGALSADAVLSLCDINDRSIEIGTYGKSITYINDSRVDTILDDMVAELGEDEYFNAYMIYLDNLDTYLGENPNPLTWTWVQGLIGLAIGAIVTAIMVSHSKGTVTTNSRTYLDQAHSGLVAKRDMYVTTTVRRIHRPQASSGGGGGNRRTPGGRSAGGGGRHF